MDFSLVFLNVLSFVFLAVIIVLSWRRRPIPGAVAFCVFVFTAFIWSLGSFFEMIFPSFMAKLLCRNLTQIGVFFLPVAALFFVFSYIGISRRIRHLVGVVLCCWQMVPLILIFSDSTLHLMRQSVILSLDSFGLPVLVVKQTIFGMICVSLNYVIMLAVIVILITTAVQKPDERKSLLIVAAGMTFPSIFSGINIALGVEALDGIPVSTSFALFALTVLISVKNFGFLTLTPAARNRTFDVIDEGILVSDADGRLVDMNPAARAMLVRHYAISDKAPASEFGSKLEKTFEKNLPNLCSVKNRCFSLPLFGSTEKKYYEIFSYELRNKEMIMGYTSILHDITEETHRIRILKAKAEHDPLTGIYNKQAFTEIVSRLLERVPAADGCLMIFDIDFFKEFNDGYGHLAGDSVLKSICKSCQEVFRSGDIFGRVGGDEFALFFDGIYKEDAFDLAERIRMTISSKKIELNDHSLTVSISAGIAYTYGTGRSGHIESFDNLFARADAALYRSKELGRNRITRAEPE